MWFKHPAWIPVAWLLSAANVGAVWFAESHFDRLQQSMDVIALEVERISEGQRSVTKILTERQPSINAGHNVKDFTPPGIQ